MAADHTPPWDPDRRWAHPLIALLVLASFWLILWRVTAQRPPESPRNRISTQARLIELRQSALLFGDAGVGRLLPMTPLDELARTATAIWDRRLYAILAAENGHLEPGRVLAAGAPRPEDPSGEAFQRCFAAAYLSQGTPPGDRTAVARALGNGYASRLLEARLAAPVEAAAQREAARRWALPRLAVLAAAGLALMLLVPAGLVVAIHLAMAPRPTGPLPEIQLSGRGLALVFLGWFLAFQLSGPLVAGLAAAVPILQPIALPLTYLLHASAGIGLLVGLENPPTGTQWKRFFPGSPAKSLLWGFGFLALGAFLVLGVSLLAGPLLRQQESPQRELMDLVAGTTGFLPTGLLFLTVAVVAPCFEECLFRGTLLPWLDSRLGARPGGSGTRTAALLLSSLGFGAIHLQPAALPVLSTLGLALGLAFLRTRNLLTPILVHGLWNGGVFLFYRMVLS